MKKLILIAVLILFAGSSYAMISNDPDAWYSDKTKNTYGLTPLMVAIDTLDLKEAKDLIEAGANKYERDRSGATAYDHAQWIRSYMTDTNEIAKLDAVINLLK